MEVDAAVHNSMLLALEVGVEREVGDRVLEAARCMSAAVENLDWTAVSDIQMDQPENIDVDNGLPFWFVRRSRGGSSHQGPSNGLLPFAVDWPAAGGLTEDEKAQACPFWTARRWIQRNWNNFVR